MAFYIKANRKVAEFLKLDKVRLKLGDGNFILWQNDMLAFGKLFELKKICERIGAIALQPWEAKQEQDGTQVRPLPEATEQRFVMTPDEDGAVDVVDNVPEAGETPAENGDDARTAPEPEPETLADETPVADRDDGEETDDETEVEPLTKDEA